MKQYLMPPDIKEKEKVIGGILDWGQFFWLLAGVGVGLFFAFSTFLMFKNEIVSILLGLIGILTGIPFAFVKRKELRLATYLILKHKLKKKTHLLMNRRKEVD